MHSKFNRSMNIKLSLSIVILVVMIASVQYSYAQSIEHILSFGNQEKYGNGTFDTPFGIAANSTHIFVADTFNHRIQILDINGNFVSQFGSLGVRPGTFFYPQDIDTNGTHFFIPDDTSRIHVYDSSGNYVTQFGSHGSGNGEFNRPRAVATNTTHIFVADTINKRIQILDFEGNYVSQFNETGLINGSFDLTYGIETNSTHVFVTTETNNVFVFDFFGNFISQIGVCCAGDGKFAYPRDVAPTANNTFILSSGTITNDPANAGLISVFDSMNASYITRFANIGNADGSFSQPQGIATDNKHLFVADTANHRIQILDFAGNFISKTGGNIFANGELSRPFAVTTNSMHILVADTQNHRVQVFDSTGNYLSQFGGFGNGIGQFNFPIDIAANGTHIFIVDLNNHRVQVFDNNGNYAYAFGERITSLFPPTNPANNGKFESPLALDFNSTHFFVSDSTNRIQVFDMNGNYTGQFGGSGSGDGLFISPRSIAVNGTHLFVTDRFNDRVQILDINGSFVHQFGIYGTSAGEFDEPSGISTNGTHLFVSDTYNHRVQIFDVMGNYVDQFGSFGNTDGMLHSPQGIATNSTHAFVADTENHRIQIFDLNFSKSCLANQFRDSIGTCITDTVLPTIKVNPSSIILEIDEPFTPPTVTLMDNDPSYVGTISNTTSPGPIDTSSIGSFTITYMATADAAGNAPDNVNATVEIVDTTAPMITVSNLTITLKIGESYTPPTFAVTDNDPDYSGTVTVTVAPNPVDTSSVGTFTVTHSAPADASGNSPDNVTATVNVTGCDADQILDSVTNTCITDTVLPTIKVNPSSIILEIDEPFTPPTVTLMDNDPSYVGTISNTTSPGPIDTSSIGSFTITYMATADAAGNAPDNVNATVEIVDTTAPMITVSNLTITLKIGESYTPPTFAVTDNDPAYSGTVTVTVAPNPVDTSSIGSFTVTHSAPADASGNAPDNVTATVNVTGCDADQILDSVTNTCITDTVLPTIKVNPSSIILEIDEPFTPPTVTLMDNDPSYVGIITNTTSPGPIDTSRIGSFTITYMATADAAGNSPVSVNATVEIVDTTAPMITVSNLTITLKIGESYTPPTFAVTDNDPDYSGTVTVTVAPNPVDTSSVGTFTVTHSAPADASGNAPDNVTATVNVTGCDADQILDSVTNTCITDTVLPTIKVNPSSIILEIDEPFTPPTVTLMDNDPSYVGIITNTTSPGPIDTSRIGSFTITYMATADAAGNAPDNVNATVEIVDTTAPMITVSNLTITLKIGESYTPPTFAVTDNDPDYSGTVTVTVAPNPVDTSSIGSFTVTHSAPADASGNSPDNVTTTVSVTGCDSNQILDSNINACVIDTESPDITVIPSSTHWKLMSHLRHQLLL